MKSPATAAAFLLVLLLQWNAASGCTAHECFSSSASVFPPSTSEEAATLLARCHIACVEKIIGVPESGGHGWPSIEVASCQDINQVMNCRVGCYLKTTGILTRKQCKEQCVSHCQNPNCSNPNVCFTPNDCPKKCRNAYCQTGCVMDFNSPQPDGDTYPPILPPTLVKTVNPRLTHSAGIFDISYTAPVSTNSSTINTTTFIFRVQTASNTYYLIQPRLEEPLDLSYFACEQVNVSFAAVNGYGLSAYSSTVSGLCIHGEVRRLPSQPQKETIKVDWVREDRRPEFIGRAEVKISWDRPEGYEHLSGYSLHIISLTSMCGGTWIQYGPYHIPREDTSIILRAETVDGPPGFSNEFATDGCVYHAVLQSQPARNVYTDGTGFTFQYETVTEPPVPTLDVECHRNIDHQTGQIAVGIYWRLGYSSSLDGPYNSTTALAMSLESIEQYQINIEIIKVLENGTYRHIQWEEIDFVVIPDDNGENAFTRSQIQPWSDSNHFVQVTVIVYPNKEYFWRPLPWNQMCRIDAAPASPSPVAATTIDIFDYSLRDGEFFLNISWQPPTSPHGTVDQYQLRVKSQEDGGVASVVYSINSGNATKALIRTNITFLDDGASPDLYVQARAMNEFDLWSNWSEAVLLTADMGNTDSPSDETGDGLPVFAYVLIAVGVLAAILQLPLMVCAVRKCRECIDIQNADTKGMPIFLGRDEKSSWSLVKWTVEPLKMQQQSDEWEVPSSSVLLEELLGSGNFGEVHKGVVRGPIYGSRMLKDSICVPVALKFLKASASGVEKDEFLNEVDMMKRVTKSSNPHIVNMVGCITVQEPLCILMEYCKYGDLLSYLWMIRKALAARRRQSKKQEGDNSYVDVSGVRPEHEGDEVQLEPDSPYANLGPVQPVNLISFAYQISSGMEFLASLEIVHRDLACRNILVGEDKKLKISDFGMSRVVMEGEGPYVKTGKGRLPWKWMAIESIVDGQFTTASDVWAYGVTLWEISTLGAFPYPTVPNGDLLEHLKAGHRLEHPDNCAQEIYQLMLECWNVDPGKRPTFTYLRSKFGAILLEESQYIRFASVDEEHSCYDRLAPIPPGGEKMSDDLSTPQAPPLPPLSSDPAPHKHAGTSEHHSSYVANPYVHTPTLLPHECHFRLDPDEVPVQQPSTFQVEQEAAEQKDN